MRNVMKKINLFVKLFFYACFTIYTFTSYGAAGSISDLSLSVYQAKSKSTSSLFSQNALKTKISRNIRFDKEHFLDPNWNENFLDSLFIQNDLVLTRALINTVPFLKELPFAENIGLFFVAGYKRLVYTDEQTIKQSCWNMVICFSDIHLGMFKPAITTDHFYSEYTLSFKLPVSKHSVMDSFILGVEAALDTSYKLLFHPMLRLRLVSSHSLDLNAYVYQTSNKNGLHYNVPFITNHQIGMRISYPKKNVFMPDLFLSSNYQFAINFNGTPFYRMSLNTSGIWSISQKMNIVASIQWSDYILQAQNTALPPHTQIFNPDKTFLSLGANYTF